MCNRIDEPIPNSIAYGVLAGIGSYIIINVTAYALRKLTGGYLTPPTYDTSEKMRIPAWTDRILYRGDALNLQAYSRAELKGSDHKPGECIFAASLLSLRRTDERVCSIRRLRR